jgi:glycosyltransferase involved in cell wall biosynthesis
MSEARKPRVCVLLPTRNEESRVAAAVQSILDQTLTDWELIAVDDGSTDRTAEVIEAFNDPRIRVVRARAAGLAASLNLGMRVAAAPLVARQDADDRSLPHRLDRQLEFMTLHPDVAVLGSAWRERGPDGAAVVPRVQFVAGRLNDVLPRLNPLAHTSVVFRRAIVLNYGGYDERLRYAQDYDLWLRLARASETLWNLDGEPLVERTMTGTNISSRRERAQIASELRIRLRDSRERTRTGMRPTVHVGPFLARTATFLTPALVRREVRRRRGQAA